MRRKWYVTLVTRRWLFRRRILNLNRSKIKVTGAPRKAPDLRKRRRPGVCPAFDRNFAPRKKKRKAEVAGRDVYRGEGEDRIDGDVEHWVVNHWRQWKLPNSNVNRFACSRWMSDVARASGNNRKNICALWIKTYMAKSHKTWIFNGSRSKAIFGAYVLLKL